MKTYVFFPHWKAVILTFKGKRYFLGDLKIWFLIFFKGVWSFSRLNRLKPAFGTDWFSSIWDLLGHTHTHMHALTHTHTNILLIRILKSDYFFKNSIFFGDSFLLHIFKRKKKAFRLFNFKGIISFLTT